MNNKNWAEWMFSSENNSVWTFSDVSKWVKVNNPKFGSFECCKKKIKSISGALLLCNLKSALTHWIFIFCHKCFDFEHLKWKLFVSNTICRNIKDLNFNVLIQPIKFHIYNIYFNLIYYKTGLYVLCSNCRNHDVG